MAIFKKKAEKETSVAPVGETSKSVNQHPKYAGSVIVRPHITEKAALKAEVARAYTFEVTSKATKTNIVAAVKELYKVTPVKVHMVNLPTKTVFARGKRGSTSGVRKAYVFLKEGDKIEFV